MLRLLKCAFLLCLASACTEIGPEINPIGMGPDLPIEEVPRKVLIEELTGVRCVNCPAGTAEVIRLQEAYGDRLIAVALHSGSFAIPYPDSREDFNTPEGTSLLNYLGSPFGYPSAVVNRKLFSGERDLQLPRGLWPVFIEEEIQVPPQIMIEINNNFDATNRSLEVAIKLTPLQDITADNLKLSVMLVEDNVQDVQLTPEGIQNDYTHRHNLRDMLTAFNGNLLNTPLEEGISVNRNYFYTIPEQWIAEQCAIVAFVHFDAEEKDVLQVEKEVVVE